MMDRVRSVWPLEEALEWRPQTRRWEGTFSFRPPASCAPMPLLRRNDPGASSLDLPGWENRLRDVPWAYPPTSSWLLCYSLYPLFSHPWVRKCWMSVVPRLHHQHPETQMPVASYWYYHHHHQEQESQIHMAPVERCFHLEGPTLGALMQLQQHPKCLLYSRIPGVRYHGRSMWWRVWKPSSLLEYRPLTGTGILLETTSLHRAV
mmetsp:Transcript_28931/g.67159  ORF Transcript_28931/g.67159 Transcript_28931/m.67159 type:complete len:205 (-) Transcript_28931:514-1128(-)